jgi:DNA/RNA-binding domain of Phe-tRNA-synthetase-like protein
MSLVDQLPFTVDIELPGWSLLWAELELQPGARDQLTELRESIVRAVRARHDRQTLTEHLPVAAMRKLFRAVGCDPTRYRPSSEALLRRLTKGDPLPAIHPFVDLSNCLSAALSVPCCVMSEGTFTPPFVFRAGAGGESYESLRGPFNLERKPLLLDALGPCDAPITGSQRVKVRADTERVWLVAYLPALIVPVEDAVRELRALLEMAPVASLLRIGSASAAGC